MTSTLQAAMNGSGYDFAAAAAYNQYESRRNDQHQQQASSRGKGSSGGNLHHQQQTSSPYNSLTGGYHVDNRPDMHGYDPTKGSSSLSATGAGPSQHRLLMASMANPYASGNPSNPLHMVAGQQQHDPTSALAALFGFTDFQSIIQDPYSQLLGNGVAGIQQQQAKQQHNGNAQSAGPRMHHNSIDDIIHYPTIHSSNPLDHVYPPMVLSNNATLGSHQTDRQQVLSVSASVFSPPKLRLGETWLAEIIINVPSLSLDALSGVEVEKRIRGNMHDVLTRYIPCVEFLVQCQQDLRKGLEIANQRRSMGGRRRSSQTMSPSEFFNTFVKHLPQSFYDDNVRTMDNKALQEAFQGLEKLKDDAESCERQGCEAVKNNFLGGMKDGESWGLRKWLSKHGNALAICTDLECLMSACQKLDKSNDSTRKLASLIRPMAKKALDKLRNDIPSSYQQTSTAHPYLPFFHRLEAALRGMATFDPDEDDVICLDDSDDDDDIIVDVVKSTSSNKPTTESDETKRRKLVECDNKDFSKSEEECPPPSKRQAVVAIDEVDKEVERIKEDDSSSSGESDEESVVEIVETQPANAVFGKEQNDWLCINCSTKNRGAYVLCQCCGASAPLDYSFASENSTKLAKTSFFDCESSFESSALESLYFLQNNKKSSYSSISSTDQTGFLSWPIMPKNQNTAINSALSMARTINQLATMFDESSFPSIRPSHIDLGTFWIGRRYAEALRLFGDILRKPEAVLFVEDVDDDSLIKAGNPPYSHIIKHPICFQDIVDALIDVTNHSEISCGKSEGLLSNRGLTKWNMWIGEELIQAVDLVLLNSLAYGKALKQGKSPHRSKTNEMRRDFWKGITEIIAKHVDNDRDKKRFTPTRRCETSGFVVYKINET